MGKITVDHKAMFKTSVREACREIKALLIAKNTKYGNSALAPLRVFSKQSRREQLLVRIDDKLSRIRTVGLDTDTVNDLIGYLVLLKISEWWPVAKDERV